MVATAVDSRIQLVGQIAGVRAGCCGGATAAGRGGGCGCCGGGDGLSLVIDARTGVVAAGHAGRGLVGIARVRGGFAAVGGICGWGRAVFVAEEAKSGLFVFGVGHFVREMVMV